MVKAVFDEFLPTQRAKHGTQHQNEYALYRHDDNRPHEPFKRLLSAGRIVKASWRGIVGRH
jgi:hypothetical protein